LFDGMAREAIRSLRPQEFQPFAVSGRVTAGRVSTCDSSVVAGCTGDCFHGSQEGFGKSENLSDLLNKAI
jgi:hypothetical protein